ncbi:MAG TPA: shikimate kinase [Bacillota bacterium]
MQTNVVLIGMPGAGKSSVGVLLAKALGMSFVDTDLLIQEKSGRLLQTIIDQDGVERFLAMEEAVILQLERENSVIATGGSAIYSEATINHLKRNGKLIYLKLKYEEIESRIKNMSSRGIAMGKGQRLIDLYNERVVLYEKYADIIVDCSGTVIESVVGKISNRIKANLARS